MIASSKALLTSDRLSLLIFTTCSGSGVGRTVTGGGRGGVEDPLAEAMEVVERGEEEKGAAALERFLAMVKRGVREAEEGNWSLRRS